MAPRLCECGRSLIMTSNKRWSRHGYRRIKGHELCRKCNASLRDRMRDRIWNAWKDERQRFNLRTEGEERPPERLVP